MSEEEAAVKVTGPSGYEAPLPATAERGYAGDCQHCGNAGGDGICNRCRTLVDAAERIATDRDAWKARAEAASEEVERLKSYAIDSNGWHMGVEHGSVAERAHIVEFMRTDKEHGGESCSCLLMKADAIEAGRHYENDDAEAQLPDVQVPYEHAQRLADMVRELVEALRERLIVGPMGDGNRDLLARAAAMVEE